MLFPLLLLAIGAAGSVAPSPYIPYMRDIRRHLINAGRDKRDQELTNSTSLDKSFSGATLFKYEQEVENTTESGDTEITRTISAGITVVCSTCYTKGSASATLRIDGTFNATEALDEVGDSVSETIDELGEWIDSIEFDLSEFELDIPAPNVTLDIEMPSFPECVLEFQFDGVELYMELDTTFSAGLAYQLTLYQSHELGIQINEDLFLGLIFSIDLILSVDAELVITSGFHIRLEDEVLLRLALFSKEASEISFNGGQFEFLPVTVESGGVVFRAILQLSLRAGFSLSSPDLTPGFSVDVFGFDIDDLSASAGIETRVYANVAEFVTNITANLDEDADCSLNVVQEYIFAVGAAAGATVGFAGHVWGPTPETEVPIFFTTLAEDCAIPAPSAKAIRAPQEESDLTATTLERTETYSATACESTGLVNCPASLQTVRENIVVETLVTSVPSGVSATWPVTTELSVPSTVPFGTNAFDMVTATGRPEAYDPTEENDDGDNDGDGDDMDLIIGLSVGLGVPFVIAIIVGFVLWRRRTRPELVKSPENDAEVKATNGTYQAVSQR